MTIQEAIEARHSLRAYKDQPLTDDVVKKLEEKIAELNNEGQLHKQYVYSSIPTISEKTCLSTGIWPRNGFLH